MKFKKTPGAKRKNYVYTYLDVNGKVKKIYIIPGEGGVTEEQVRRLHALDDSEVYNNLKNFRSPLSDDMKANTINWMKEHPYSDIPWDKNSNYNISLDYCSEHPEDKTAQKVNIQTCTYFDDVPEDVERLRRAVEKLPEFDRKVYELVVINEMSNVEAAAILSVTEGTIRYHMNKIKEYIRDSFMAVPDI